MFLEGGGTVLLATGAFAETQILKCARVGLPCCNGMKLLFTALAGLSWTTSRPPTFRAGLERALWALSHSYQVKTLCKSKCDTVQTHILVKGLCFWLRTSLLGTVCARNQHYLEWTRPCK